MPTAEERRELRQRKILENANKRMNIILGTETGEKRQAPAMEGGNPYGTKWMEDTKNDRDKITINNNDLKPDGESIPSPPAESTNEQQAPAPQPINNHTNRIIAAAFIGVLLRVCIYIGLLDCNLLLPWALYESAIELYMHHTQTQTQYPGHSHLVNILLYFGYNEKLVLLGGRVSDVLTRVANDSVVMFVCFIFLHMCLA